jgi:murein DD-endopeptidase MepM/ murein hydrolase activator NlpD
VEEMKIKKFIRTVVAAALMVALIPVTEVYAEDPPYSNTTYWSGYCSIASNSGSSDCDGYRTYLSTQSSKAASDLADIKSQKAQIAANLASYTSKLKDLQTKLTDKQTEIDNKQAEIDSKQTEITNKQAEIDAKQAQIDTTQTQVDTLKKKVKDRMVNSQGTMRLSEYVDILMGASSFEEFLRIANGLQSISDYDQETQQQLVSLIDQLNTEKDELNTAMAELQTAMTALQTAKDELVTQQNDLILLREQTQVIIDEQEATAASLEAQGDAISSNISNIAATLKKVQSSGGLDNVIAASGWTNPVPGATRSAGTWNYSSGGVHLGYDFAASIGTTIVAAANGVVINSANGCPTYGGLGNTCGSQYGGSHAGGNQVYLLVKVNGNLYAMKYLHMKLNTPISTGTTVSAGTKIGEVGSSGNSSGGHCHIEIFYLGDASNFASYAASWNGDLAFGCGWAGSYDGYGRRCDAGYGAPCRIRPESVFGS